MANRAPKQWCLGKDETISSFESWRNNIIYCLSLDQNYAPFLEATWERKSRANPHRAFTDDGAEIPVASRRTSTQKNTIVEMMLGQVANYCPGISRNSIVKNSTSLSYVWQIIRQHYGFQTSGSHFLDFDHIRPAPDERPEDLFQRLTSFIDDSLLTADSHISHHGIPPTEDEEVSPTLENLIVLTWLRLLHPSLPKLVKQRYGTELRSRTLASIKPEISQALDSLLDELGNEASINQTFTRPQYNQRRPPQPRPRRRCSLCSQMKRPNTDHFLSRCPFLSESDRKYMVKTRQIIDILDDDPAHDTTTFDEEHVVNQSTSAARRVKTDQSPYVDMFSNHHPVRIVVDSGATGNMIRHSTAKRLGAKIIATSQSARQADGSSPLKVVGETRFTLERGDTRCYFEGLVVENLDTEILGGVPFMTRNDLTVRPAKLEIWIGDIRIEYGSVAPTPDTSRVRRAHVLRAPEYQTTLWPGDYMEFSIPDCEDTEVAIEPRLDSGRLVSERTWPQPIVTRSVGGKVRLLNNTSEPQQVRRSQHFCQAVPMYSPPTTSDPSTSRQTVTVQNIDVNKINTDPDNLLSATEKQKFLQLATEFSDVFGSDLPGYNGSSGRFEAIINMGPTQPPQRRGRLPHYNDNKLKELQNKFDELEEIGVFARPESLNVAVEYVNPSFLVSKPNGGHRLVTAFSSVGRYSKPQPSAMPDVDSTLRKISQWRYIIKTDLTSAFYQIPLARESMKYCGVVTPFRGMRVYTRCAMGMPGSETALEELMCRILGDLLLEGYVVKLADDLYIGGNYVESVILTWRKVLTTLAKANLRLSALKTTICPKSTTILGWIWSEGSLTAGPHRISTLATCQPPNTIKGLRSFIGAYKVLSRVISNCSQFLAPLDEATAGKESKETIQWSDHLREAFTGAQKHLASAKTIHMPRPTDQLWIVTDGSVKQHSIGALMYADRGGKLLLCGHFSARLHGHQPRWLPCEVEALAIAGAVKHFGPYLIQSEHHPVVLTDSKPCVQAYEKLSRGQFSASPRLTSFLSTVCRFQASIRHLAGKSNIPADFASRNAPECTHLTCQVCSYVHEQEEVSVFRISLAEIIRGSATLPYTSRPAWRDIQNECPDLRRTCAHLTQGTRPSKRLTDVRDVKRYLQAAILAQDGLIVVRRNDPLLPQRDTIVVPRHALHALLTALHIKLDHPTKHQMHQVVTRYFYALDLSTAIDETVTSCHQCASLGSSPVVSVPQSSDPPPQTHLDTGLLPTSSEETGSRFSSCESTSARTQPHLSYLTSVGRLCEKPS